jgi:hypothetical protein
VTYFFFDTGLGMDDIGREITTPLGSFQIAIRTTMQSKTCCASVENPIWRAVGRSRVHGEKQLVFLHF